VNFGSQAYSQPAKPASPPDLTFAPAQPSQPPCGSALPCQPSSQPPAKRTKPAPSNTPPQAIFEFGSQTCSQPAKPASHPNSTVAPSRPTEPVARTASRPIDYSKWNDLPSSSDDEAAIPTKPVATAASRPIDYSKWDDLPSSSDDEAAIPTKPPPREEPPQAAPAPSPKKNKSKRKGSKKEKLPQGIGERESLVKRWENLIEMEQKGDFGDEGSFIQLAESTAEAAMCWLPESMIPLMAKAVELGTARVLAALFNSFFSYDNEGYIKYQGRLLCDLAVDARQYILLPVLMDNDQVLSYRAFEATVDARNPDLLFKVMMSWDYVGQCCVRGTVHSPGCCSSQEHSYCSRPDVKSCIRCNKQWLLIIIKALEALISHKHPHARCALQGFCLCCRIEDGFAREMQLAKCVYWNRTPNARMLHRELYLSLIRLGFLEGLTFLLSEPSHASSMRVARDEMLFVAAEWRRLNSLEFVVHKLYGRPSDEANNRVTDINKLYAREVKAAQLEVLQTRVVEELTPILVAINGPPDSEAGAANRQVDEHGLRKVVDFLVAGGADLDKMGKRSDGRPIGWEDCVLACEVQPEATFKTLKHHSKRASGWVENSVRWLALQAKLTVALKERSPKRVASLLEKRSTGPNDWQPSSRPGAHWQTSPLSNALQAAVIELAEGDDEATLVELLRHCPASLIFSNGSSLLHFAAAANRDGMVKVLVDHGADACLEDREGATPLHLAAAENAIKAAEALLRSSSGLRALDRVDKQSRRPLDCVERVKASASANAAKLMRKLLQSYEGKPKPALTPVQQPRSGGGATRGRGAKGSRVNATCATVGDAVGTQAVVTTPVVAAAVVETEADALHSRLIGGGAEAIREALAAELRKPREEVAVPSTASQAQTEVGEATVEEEADVQPEEEEAMEGSEGENEHSKVEAESETPGNAEDVLTEEGAVEVGVSDSLQEETRREGASERAETAKGHMEEEAHKCAARATAETAVPTQADGSGSCVVAGDESADEAAKAKVEEPPSHEAHAPQTEASSVGPTQPAPAVEAQLTARERVLRLESFENHPWRVLIIRSAAHQMSALDAHDKEKALQCLHTVASGIWSGHSIKHLSGKTIPSALSLYESKFSKGARIIWSVGIDYVASIFLYQQTIRVWAVDRSHDAAQRSIERVCAIHRRGLTSLISRKLRTRVARTAGTQCVLPKSYEVAANDGEVGFEALEQRWNLAASGVVDPAVASAAENGNDDWDEETRYPPAVEQEDAYNLVKFYSLDRPLVYSIVASTFSDKLEYPFLPDEAEHLIICLSERRSILLLGRSGTGKTTIVVQRMWLKYRAALQAIVEAAEKLEPESAHAELSSVAPPNQSDAPLDEAPASLVSTSPRIHQLFVTANPILRSSVAKSFRALQSGFMQSHTAASLAQPPAQEEFSELTELMEHDWPLFFRAHQWLRLLDATLEPDLRFFTDEERRDAATRSSDGLHSEEGCAEFLPDLDLDDAFDEEEEDLTDLDGEVGASSRTREEVTYELFQSVLWPLMIGKERADGSASPRELKLMAQTLAEKSSVRSAAFKPSIVFREIVSYIKGSAQALETENGHLSRDEYMSLGRKVAPAFEKSEAAGQTDATGGRSTVYDLFLKYETWKAKLNAFDVMDACFSIFRGLQKTGYSGPRIDEVYVDEVQDFTQAEIRLFLEACADKNALFFTGDTCQTIARGVGFRFEELTTMFFNTRAAQIKKLEARGIREADVPKEQLCKVPEISKLSINYRTHNGILGAASEIVSLLLALFPAAIDQLRKDVGHFDGPKPVLLTNTTKEDLSILLCGVDPSNSQIEFGAHQAVLVRSQAAKERLPVELRTALVLTIFESKGLEFDEVFIFDFFADSPADEKTWRVLTHCLQQQQTAAHNDESSSLNETEIAQPRPVKFDRSSHSLLNEELKMLYTAITRARVKVVIYDQHKEKRAPMFHYFLAKQPPLAQIFDSSSAGRSGLARSSTPEEWCAQAKNLMRNKLFEIAVLCYRRGNDPQGMCQALAMHFFKTNELLRAALCFEQVGLTQHCASCLRRAGEYTLAAQAYRKLGKSNAAARMLSTAAERTNNRAQAVALYGEAASEFERAGNLSKAVLLRLSHKELRREGLDMVENRKDLFHIALPYMERLKLFDSAYALCSMMGEEYESKAEELAKASAFHHKNQGDKDAMLEAVRHFRSTEFQFSFLMKHGEPGQVAELLLERGQPQDALDELIIASDFDRSMKLVQNPNMRHAWGAGSAARNQVDQAEPGPASASATESQASVLYFLDALRARQAGKMEELLKLLPQSTEPSLKLRSEGGDRKNAASSRNRTHQVSTLDERPKNSDVQPEAASNPLLQLLILDKLLEMSGNISETHPSISERSRACDAALIFIGHLQDDNLGAESAFPQLLVRTIRELVKPARLHVVCLHWLLRCFWAAIELISASQSDLEWYTLRFLRVQTPSAKTKQKMPTWRWVCTHAGHDYKKTLLGSSAMLRSLVQKAALSVVTSWFDRLSHLEEQACKHAMKSEKIALQNRHTAVPPQMCTEQVSATYLEVLMLELQILSSARALDRARADGGAAPWQATLKGVTPRFRKAVQNVVHALFPVSCSSAQPDYTAELPYACHRVVTAAFATKLRSLTATMPKMREEFIWWLDSNMKKLSPNDMIKSLDNTALMWQILALSSAPQQFEKRFKKILAKGQSPSTGSVGIHSGHSAYGKHPSIYLQYLELLEHKGLLVDALKQMTDYLKESEHLMNTNSLHRV